MAKEVLTLVVVDIVYVQHIILYRIDYVSTRNKSRKCNRLISLVGLIYSTDTRHIHSFTHVTKYNTHVNKYILTN